MTGQVESGAVVLLDGTAGTSTNIVPTTHLVSRDGWMKLSDEVRCQLDAYHRANPLRRGLPKEELRTRLGLEGRVFSRAVSRLLADGVAAEVGPFLALPGHEVQFTPELRARAERLLADLRAAGASPPSRQELEARHRFPNEATQVLIARGELVEVAGDLLYPRDVLDRLIGAIVAAVREQGAISVAGVRDLTGTSRKYSLAILAHLDERRVTKRVGDDRVLV